MTSRLRATAGGLLFAAALLVPGVAGAQDYVGGEDPKVKGGDIVRPQVDADDSGGLPITGGDVLGLTAIGVASVGIGAVLVRRTRRTA